MSDVEPLQHLLLVGDAQIHVGGREIREASGIGHIHLEDLGHFVRNAIHQLGQRFRRGNRACHELVQLHGIGRRFLGALDLRNGERVHLVDRVDRDASEPLQRDLDRIAGQVDPFVHPGGHAHASDEVVRIDRVVPVAGGDHQRHDQPGLLVRTEQREVLGGAHLHGDRPQRVHDRGAQRHQGQRRGQLGAKNFFLTLATRHRDASEPRIRS